MHEERIRARVLSGLSWILLGIPPDMGAVYFVAASGGRVEDVIQSERRNLISTFRAFELARTQMSINFTNVKFMDRAELAVLRCRQRLCAIMRKYFRQGSWAMALRHALPEETPEPDFKLSQAQVEKLKNFSQALLAILSVVGIATMAVLAPNALQALSIFENGRKRQNGRFQGTKSKNRKIVKTFYYLKQKKWVEFRRKGEDFEVAITARGKKQLRKIRLQSLAVAKPEKWDGKFWEIIADIPTKDYRQGADALRKKLKELGFFHLQRTVWFYPFDPRLEIEFITRYFGIFNFVTVMQIAKLDPADEKPMKKFFKKQGII